VLDGRNVQDHTTFALDHSRQKVPVATHGGHEVQVQCALPVFFRQRGIASIRAIWTAVQVALFGRTVDLFPAGGARSSAYSRSEGSENWIEPLDDLGLASNHHAVTALQTPNPSAGSHIDVVDLLGRELLCTPEIIDVIRVAPVNEDVPHLKMRRKIGDGVIDNCRRHHQPDRSWSLKFLHDVCERYGADRLFLDEFVHHLR
jgi:hypothetical protein